MRAILIGTMLVASPLAAQDKTYAMTGFDAVDVSAGVVVDIAVGPAFEVTADVRKGDIDRLEVDVRGRTLRISRKTSWGAWLTSHEDQFFMTVTLPRLLDVDVSSGATVQVAGAIVGDFVAEVASGATLRLNALDVQAVALEASSGATLHATGSCSQIRAEASSGATLNAAGLICETGTVESSSGATLLVHTSKKIVAEASSGASVVLSGGGAQSVFETSSGGRIVTE